MYEVLKTSNRYYTKDPVRLKPTCTCDHTETRCCFSYSVKTHEAIISDNPTAFCFWNRAAKPVSLLEQIEYEY